MFSALSGDIALVGRNALLAEIEAALRRDDVYGILVYGDTGTGKSVLARHLLERPHGNFVPFLVTPASGLTGIPYGALAPFLIHATPQDMASPLSVLRVVLTFLRRNSDGRPILVVVDDAHLLDDDSSHLLVQLTTSRTVVLAAFACPTTPTSDELVSLCRDGLLERFDVGPLDHDEALELCTQVLGAGIVRGASDRLCDEASGNPLFLKAILDEALVNGSLSRFDGVWTLDDSELRIPGALVDLVRAVTLELDDDERKAFEVLALGGVVSFADLVRVSGEPGVFGLLSRGLVRSYPGDPAFAVHAHDLYGRIARRLVPVGRSSRLHREVQALDQESKRLPARARIGNGLWSLDCGEPVADDALVELAGLALSLLDASSALRFAGAVRAEPHLIGALLHRGVALLELGRIEESSRVAEGLLEKAPTPGSVAVAGGLEMRLVLASGGDVRSTGAIVDRWSRALDALAEPTSTDSPTTLPVPGPATRARTSDRFDGDQCRLVAQAFGWNLAGRYGETVESLRRVLAVDGNSLGVRVLAHALLAEALAARGLGSEGRHHSAMALDLVESGRQPMRDLHRVVFLRHVSLLVHSGDFAGARAALTQYAPGEGRDYRFISGSLAVLDAAVDVRCGSFRSGLGKLRPALVSLRASDPDGLLPYALGITAWAAAALGESALSAQCSAELALVHGRGGRQYALLGMAHDAAAQALLQADTTSPVLLRCASEARSNAWFSCEKDILEMATTLGDDRPAVLLARVTGMLEGTEAAVLHDYAAALIARDAGALAAAGDRAEVSQKNLLALSACSRAMEAYVGAGDVRSQRALTAVVRRRRTLVDGSLPAEPAGLEGPSPLTIREREIALLAIEGMSNRDIARRLTVSTRTVEGHLYRIYVKLGISRREELTTEVEFLLRAT